MAKKFSFRLEPLLKLRSHKVSDAKDSLAMVLRVRYGKDELIKEKSDYKNNLLQNKYSSSKAADMQTRIAHKSLIEKEIEKAKKEREQLLEIESVRRYKLNEAMKEEKILQKLKEKKIEQYNYEVNLEENSFIDEIAVSRFRLKQGSEE